MVKHNLADRKLKVEELDNLIKEFNTIHEELKQVVRQRDKDGKIKVKKDKLSVTNQLRKCCITKYGLVSKEMRAKIWPIILGIDVEYLPNKPNRTELRKTQEKDFNQVKLDVDRCISRLPENLPEDQISSYQENLTDLILYVLSRHEQLNYYQGYHDVAITILQICGMRLAMPVTEKMTTLYLRDFMQSTMDNTKHVLNLIFPLIKEIDPELYSFLQESQVGTYFALSWLITWYGHVVKDFKRTSRIYDFFMATHPAMPMYLAAEIVLHKRECILETDCDMPSVHHLLSSIVKDDLPDEELIEKAVKVFIECPPSELTGSSKTEETEFYKTLIMARQSAKSPTLYDILKTEEKFKFSKSANYFDKSDCESNESFIKSRRRVNMEKTRIRYGIPSDRKKKLSPLARYLTYLSFSAVAVAIASFWLQKYYS